MLNKVGSTAGIIGLIVTILGWIGVTPEMVGQTAYDILYVALPILSGVFGIVAGWCLHGILVDANAVKSAAVEAEKQKGETERERIRAEEAEAKRIHEAKQAKAERDRQLEEKRNEDRAFVKKISSFPDIQKALLFDVVNDGTVITSGKETIEAQSLEADGLLTKIGKSGFFGQAWKPTDLTRDCINDNNFELWDEFQGKSYERSMRLHNDRLDRQMTSFLDLSFDQRWFVHEAWKKGHCDYNYLSVLNDGCDSDFLDDRDIGDGISRFTIKEEYKDLFKERERQCFEAIEAWNEKQQEA